MTDFTDDDVAAAQSAWRQVFGGYAAGEEIETVLAAVLPEYRKRVRADALREAADWWATNGDQQAKETWAEVSAWLRARADAEEAPPSAAARRLATSGMLGAVADTEEGKCNHEPVKNGDSVLLLTSHPPQYECRKCGAYYPARADAEKGRDFDCNNPPQWAIDRADAEGRK